MALWRVLASNLVCHSASRQQQLAHFHPGLPDFGHAQRQVTAEEVAHVAENEGGEHVGLVVPIFVRSNVGQGVGKAEELLLNQLVHIAVEVAAAGVHFPQGDNQAASAVYPVGGFGHHVEERIKSACLEAGEDRLAVFGFEIGNHLSG